MAYTSTWLVAVGQIGLGIGLLICYLIAPRLVRGAENGVSNYGAHGSTIFPYSLAFLAAGICTILAGRFALQTSPRLTAALYFLGILYLAALISTYVYQQSPTLRSSHIVIGGFLYSAQLFISLWYVTHVPASLLALLLVAIQVAGAVLSLVSLMHLIHILFIGQIITGVSFGILLVFATNHILSMPTR